ncbi:MAG TPA: hypothetical protein VKT30_02320 [Caulobacteraceae bacterium]|nr:hypothetical protein [Caulobacteraceae bacterium]
MAAKETVRAEEVIASGPARGPAGGIRKVRKRPKRAALLAGIVLAASLGLAMYPLDAHRQFEDTLSIVPLAYDFGLACAVRLIVSGNRLGRRVALSVPVGVAVVLAVITIYMMVRGMNGGLPIKYAGPAVVYLVFGFYEGLPTIGLAFLLSFLPLGRLLATLD